MEKITSSVTGQLWPVGCETNILWSLRKMQATYFFWDLIYVAIDGSKIKKKVSTGWVRPW
ncbi:hypothetical protein EBU02_10475 [bacterium]|nr:hypothetical protein [bacterium]